MRNSPLIGSCRLGGIERKGCRFPATLYKPSLSASSSNGKPLEGQSICEGASKTGTRQCLLQIIPSCSQKDAAAYQRGADDQCRGIASAVQGLLLSWKVPFSKKVTSASECGLTINAKHPRACREVAVYVYCVVANDSSRNGWNI